MSDQNFKILYDIVTRGFDDMNKRFEQVDKRFEQVDKRFDQVDKRFEQVHNEIHDMRIEMHDMRVDIQNVQQDFKKLDNMKITWTSGLLITTVCISVALSVFINQSINAGKAQIGQPAITQDANQ